MDWKSLTQKLDPLKEKLTPFLDTAKNAGIKTLDFTQRQMQNTPLVLKTQKDLDALRDRKRLIVIVYDQTDPSSRELLLRAPVWTTRAWTDNAELRWVEKSASPDIISLLNITTPVNMHVWYIGELTANLHDVQSILNWWKTRCYDGKEDDKDDKKEDLLKEKRDTKEDNSDNPPDPLSGK